MKAARSRPTLAKQLRWVFATAVLAALVGAGLTYWDRLSGVRPAQLVEVYRTHGCRCVFAWARALEDQGFVVRVREYETLQYVRRSLHTPQSLHGCHVGSYEGYFVEGHVSPAALKQLLKERPVALGVATQSATTMDAKHLNTVVDDGGRALLIDAQGQPHTWFPPPENRNKG